MNKSRLEAFSDGVFAIIITIMVLELKIPNSADRAALAPLVPVLICYVLSFLYLAIYWMNHHHLMHTVKRISASIMWANMHLLFWLSLVPFCTGWMGRTNFDKTTVAVYGVLLLVCGFSYSILNKAIRSAHSEKQELVAALSRSRIKEWVSIVAYTTSIPIALYIHPIISAVLFGIVSVIWLIPSKEIERALDNE
jgi:uncharacterized membrane protein